MVLSLGGFCRVALWGCCSLLPCEVLDYERWHKVSPLITAKFRMAAELGPVESLPFERSMPFLWVLCAPGSSRINPLQPSP